MAEKDRGVHLFVLIHGLWGGPSHLAAAKEELIKLWKAQHPAQGGGETKRTDQVETDLANGNEDGVSGNYDPTVTTEVGVRRRSRRLQSKDASEATNGVSDVGENGAATEVTGMANGTIESGVAPDDLVVVIAGGMSSTLTYDGIDVNASRVAWELDEKIAELESEGKKVTRFSVLGYSLGGVIARYLIGLLHSRTPSFFEQHRPVSFTTVACPHLGIPAYNTFFSAALVFLGSRLLARTGRQLYVRDKYSEEDPRPLLEIMADPESVFYKALKQFQHFQVFANGTRDFTVPYPSAALEPTDPFLEWEDQGLEVESDESDLMTSWSFPSDEKAEELKRVKKSSWKNPMDRLPPVLKDRFQYNPALMIVFPIAVPFIILLMIIRLSMDARRSSNRLALLTGPTSTSAQNGDKRLLGSRHGLSIDHLRDTIGVFERELESDLYEELDPEGPSSSLKGSRGRSSARSARQSKSSANNSSPLAVSGPEKIRPDQMPSIQIQLNESQRRMLDSLSALKPDRYVTWYPDIGNSHAVAICRDPTGKPVHNRGRGLLRVWAKSVLDQDGDQQ